MMMLVIVDHLMVPLGMMRIMRIMRMMMRVMMMMMMMMTMTFLLVLVGVVFVVVDIVIVIVIVVVVVFFIFRLQLTPVLGSLRKMMMIIMILLLLIMMMMISLSQERGHGRLCSSCGSDDDDDADADDYPVVTFFSYILHPSYTGSTGCIFCSGPPTKIISSWSEFIFSGISGRASFSSSFCTPLFDSFIDASHRGLWT